MKAQTLTDREPEHQRQVQELTQRIGELCQQVNDRDKFIETAGEDFRRELNEITGQRDALLEICRAFVASDNQWEAGFQFMRLERCLEVLEDVKTVEGGE